MIRKIQKTCRHADCDNFPYLGGLCREHDEEDRRKRKRRATAIDTLHTGVIDGRIPEDLALRDELQKIQAWWDKACRAVQQRQTIEPLPLDEADYALEWCIALAQEIVDAELAHRAGNTPGHGLEHVRHWVWERFGFLTQGLHSNGTARRDN